MNFEHFILAKWKKDPYWEKITILYNSTYMSSKIDTGSRMVATRHSREGECMELVTNRGGRCGVSLGI